MRFLAEGCEATGLLRSASRAGVFIAASELPQVGSPVVVQFESPSGPLVNVRGEVRWTTKELARPDVPTGFGVLLHEPPTEYRHFFLWAMERVEKKPEPNPGEPKGSQ